ncbi:MAG: Flp family type IVb pilin [Methylotenera sp.]|nr:Flp family type IVb pilin [Methylotenera sp.]MDO9232516.1 Flp family type IVb pilin [Methylotenera sp.]MDO9388751.1 Flp family type IVb pilin [Methylotenera sp.]MDP2403537.1 Flp family type IVb pilin [Methylotenera sp.]MDP3095638.1 Flp family type IVb pilin [Methylotenera sp.]
MKNLYLGLQRFVNDEEGVTAIEYALIASLIAVVIIGAVQLTGTRVNDVFTRVAAALAPATP